jgi:predicted transcriptional regulator
METKKKYRTWSDFKKEFNRSEDELIDQFAHLVSKRMLTGITQKEFAKRIGMSQPQLAKLEMLDRLPSLKTIERYAAGLNLEMKLHMEFVPKKA